MGKAEPAAYCSARLVTHFVSVRPRQMASTMLVFRTEFNDGTLLLTANDQIAGLFPNLRIRKGSCSFPWIANPNALYAIHRASVAHFAPTESPSRQTATTPIVLLKDTQRQETARFVEVGYCYHDEQARVFHYTWKGAAFMTLKLISPIGPFRGMLRNRKACRILREIGLQHLAPGSPALGPASVPSRGQKMQH